MGVYVNVHVGVSGNMIGVCRGFDCGQGGVPNLNPRRSASNRRRLAVTDGGWPLTGARIGWRSPSKTQNLACVRTALATAVGAAVAGSTNYTDVDVSAHMGVRRSTMRLFVGEYMRWTLLFRFPSRVDIGRGSGQTAA